MSDQVIKRGAPLTSGTSRGPRLADRSAPGGDSLAEALRTGRLGALSNAGAILLPFLAALNWRGTDRDLFEAMPHFADDMDLTEIRKILSHLGYPTLERKTDALSDVDDRLIPCIATMADGTLYIVLARGDNGYDLIDGKTGDTLTKDELTGIAAVYVVAPEDRVEQEASRKSRASKSWIGDLIYRFSPTVWRMWAISFVLNFLALLTPLFILMIYDQVIPIGSVSVWVGLGVGLVAAFLFEAMLRFRRARMVAYVGSRLDFAIASSTFGKLLSLPANMTESVPIGDQVAKLRDFDTTRDVFTGLLITVVLDLPFVLLSFALLAVISGPIALIPVGMMALYGLLWFGMSPTLRRAVTAASRAKAVRHAFLVEAVSNMRVIKECAVEDTWAERYRDYSAASAVAQNKSAQIAFLIQTLSQALMVISGLATLTIGVSLALEGSLSLGALIASMAIIWRILSPLQSLFLSLSRLEQVRVAIKQIDSLMSIKGEAEKKQQSAGVRRAWQGDIRFHRVSLRYSATSEPAILGANFAIKPREFLAITGANGAGKSSFLRVLMGLQKPQAGQVLLDGIDVRQISPPELRTTMAYVPQIPKLFHGTIAQNLRLGNPAATDEQIQEAVELAGLTDDLKLLRDGLNTRIGDQSIWQMNAGFTQKIGLARAYAMDGPVLVLDEPANALDDRGDEALVKALEAFRYKKTIVMVSHRPSHIKLADRVLILKGGSIIEDASPADILNRGGSFV